MNAVRVAIPLGAIPASVVPYDREVLHAFLDRNPQDMHALRMGGETVVVPLGPDAALPSGRKNLKASEHPRLVATLAREAVFREITARADKGYRVTRRRPLVVEAARPETENVLPKSLGLPDWLKKRLVLEFEARALVLRGAVQVVLTCSNRLRTVIDASVKELRELGVPLLGTAVTTFREAADPKVAGRLRYAGRVLAVADDGTLTLEDHGEGSDTVSDTDPTSNPRG